MFQNRLYCKPQIRDPVCELIKSGTLIWPRMLSPSLQLPRACRGLLLRPRCGATAGELEQQRHLCRWGSLHRLPGETRLQPSPCINRCRRTSSSNRFMWAKPSPEQSRGRDRPTLCHRVTLRKGQKQPNWDSEVFHRWLWNSSILCGKLSFNPYSNL